MNDRIRVAANTKTALCAMAVGMIFSVPALAQQAPSQLEANKAVVRQYFDTFNSNQLDRLPEVISPEYGDRLEGQAAGIEVLRTYLKGLKASFPDFTWTIEQIVAEGDRVAVMNRITGTQVRDFGGVKAGGRKVDFKAFQIYKVVDGKLVEHWEVADFAKFQEQLSGKAKSSAFRDFQKKSKS